MQPVFILLSTHLIRYLVIKRWNYAPSPTERGSTLCTSVADVLTVQQPSQHGSTSAASMAPTTAKAFSSQASCQVLP